jgi:hypothetical protein
MHRCTPLLLVLGALLAVLGVRQAARETHVVKVLSGPHVTQTHGRITLTTYAAQESR